MKEGWEMKRLGEVCKTGAGGTPLKSHKDYYEGGTISWIRSGEVNNRNITESEMKITQQGLDNSSAKLFPPKTVVIAMYGATAGQVGILNFECATNQAVCGILPNENFIPEFLYYFFLKSKEELISQAVGNAQPNISQAKIRNTLIPIIPLPEQKQIVAILDKAFAAIHQAQAHIEKNIANAKELFQSKLNEIFSQKGEGWVEKTLGEVVKIIGGGTPSKKNKGYYNGNIPWATVRDMNCYNLSQTELTITEMGLRNSSSNVIPKGEVIIATRVGLGKVCLLSQNTAINQDLKGLIPINKDLNRKFLFFWYKSIADTVEKDGVGMTVKGVNLNYVKALKISIPNIETQEAVVKLCSDLRERTESIESHYQQRLTNLEELKKSLLQKAFAGELTQKEAMV